MDEKQYQIDLLTAMNKKLTQNDHILKMIVESSDHAYVYYSFVEKKTEFIGDVLRYTGVSVRDYGSLKDFVQSAEEQYREKLMGVIELEQSGNANADAIYSFPTGAEMYECSAFVKYDAQSKPTEKIIVFRSISKYNKQSDELVFMAYYDTLTPLYNRNYFVYKLGLWLEKAKEESNILSVMYINIDDFSKINYRYGIEAGDEVVQLFGQYLKDFESDTVMAAHFTGDIFCIAIYDPCGAKSVENIYNQIYERLNSPFLMTGHREVKFSVSVGVAEYPEAAPTVLKLITYAEIVLKSFKKSGKNSIHYFDAKMMNRFMQDVMVEEKLKTAVNNNSLMLYYQPQYDSQSGRMRGVEALLRWRDTDGTMISPAIFIPIAEKSNIILAIGDWVLNEALSTYAEWKKKYGVDFIMSINISALQYSRPDFVAKLLELIDKYDIDHKDLELEITESVLIEDFDDVIGKMNILRDYGIRISLDDFGTGFSSMSYLKGLPIDTLKIDKSFIDTITTDTSTQIITQSIVTMVKQLGFETVAEGVETEEQYDYLRNIRCDNIQGFLLGKPMPESSIEDLLQKKD